MSKGKPDRLEQRDVEHLRGAAGEELAGVVTPLRSRVHSGRPGKALARLSGPAAAIVVAMILAAADGSQGRAG